MMGESRTDDRKGEPVEPVSRLLAIRLLEEGFSRYLGRPVRVVSLESEPVEAQSTYPIDRLYVSLDSGERVPVIFKRLRPEADHKGSQREVLIYRRVLAEQQFGAPLLYASRYDEPGGCYWLFLEDVGEETLSGGDISDWLEAFRWLAEMHGTWLGREEDLRALDCLTEHGADYYHVDAQIARRHLESAGRPAALARFDSLMARFDELVAWLLRQPRTLVHGDIFAENLMLQPGGRIRPIDWESAGIGLAAWDLTRLLDGWGTDRPMFFDVYWKELALHRTVRLDRPTFERTLTRCEILDALVHLSWDEERCQDSSFVDSALDQIEQAWRQVDETDGVG
jgi:hypothetical protein